LGAGFAFRTAEAPGGAEPFDRVAFQARLGNPDEARVGLKIRDAMRLMKDRENAGQNAPPQGGRGGVPGIRPPQGTPRDQIGNVIEQGWGAATPEFKNWLGVMAADPWPANLAEAAGMAPGVFIDPRDEIQGKKDAVDARTNADLLTALALKEQAAGSDEVALEHLITVLALSRHLRHQAPAYAYLQGVEAERDALVALDHWLGQLGGQPKLLHRAGEALKAHEAGVAPVSEALEGEYLRFYSSLGNKGRAGTAMGVDTEALVMQTPWEATRARRLTDAVFSGRRRMAESGEVVSWSDDDSFADWLPEPGGVGRDRLERLVRSSWLAGSIPSTVEVQRAAQLSQCRVRAARLQLALALYRAEHGKAAASLDDLGPGLPEDPFARQPFHYRVSAGERIAWQRRLPGGGMEFVRDVPAGWGVLWSVGPDGNDDGAARQSEDDKRAQMGRDMIFLVPPASGGR
jgi:hypothetical protein